MRSRLPSAVTIMLLAATSCCSSDGAEPKNTDAAARADPGAEPAAPEPASPAPREAPKDPPPAPTPPEPLTEYMGRTIARTMHWRGAEWLMRATREAEENSSAMLDALGLEPGMTACDLGCGNGFHTLRMADTVGEEGRVLAVDIQEPMLAMLRRRYTAREITWIEPILATASDPKLPPASCDVVLMVDVYHEISYPEQVLAGVRRALRPGGRLVLVEFREEDPDVPIKPLHKMSRAQVDREMEANGFELAGTFDELPWQHMLFYRAR